MLIMIVFIYLFYLFIQEFLEDDDYKEVDDLEQKLETYKGMNTALPNKLKTGVYSSIPILRPPLGLSKSGLKDHF